MTEPTASAICACLYPALYEIAHRAGYALAVRGGLHDDLDVIAVPWVSNACEPSALVQNIADYFSPSEQPAALLLPNQRPHGRLEWMIPVGWYGTTISLSVMPRLE